MKTTLLALALIAFSTVGAVALTKRMLADHTHADLQVHGPGIFDVGHSGGLDQNGGHYDRKTGIYHYHR